jgi:colicin import membrane protein
VNIPPLPPRNEPNLFWLLAISLALHVAVFLVFSGVFFNGRHIERRPVYYVDLSKMPVLNPQAGRPDGSPAPKAKKTAKPKAAVPAPKPAAPPAKTKKPKTVPAAPKPTKPKPTPSKTATKAAKPKPQPAQSPASTGQNYQSVQEKLAAMREKQQRQQELAALKNKIAALSGDAGTDSGSHGSGAPLGMPDGKGDEIGVDQQTWLRAFYKENWSLSKYQVTRLDLEATVSITYNSEGHLINYRFVKSSGDSTFDDSLKRAILKDRILPFKPGRTLQLDVVFNLKDLMD